MKIQTSLSVEKELYSLLSDLALRQKRSIAAILRDATSEYVKKENKHSGFNKPAPGKHPALSPVFRRALHCHSGKSR